MNVLNNDEISIKLSQQAYLIHESLKSLEYLINFSEYLLKIENDNPKDLWFLFHVIRNNTILNLYKLFEPNQNYSFDSVKNLAWNKFDKSNKRVEDYLSTLKAAKKLYTKLRITKIRHTHIGHLDYSRKKESINWHEVKKLTKMACKIHDQINLHLNNQQTGWIIDLKFLNQIFSKDLRSKELFKKRRELSRNPNDSVSFNEIVELTKINWP